MCRTTSVSVGCRVTEAPIFLPLCCCAAANYYPHLLNNHVVVAAAAQNLQNQLFHLHVVVYELR